MLLPQIWVDTIMMADIRSLQTPNPLSYALLEWDEKHHKRMRADPEYAKHYEALEREWMTLGEWFGER